MDEISYSKILTWKRCLKKFCFKYVDNLKPIKKPSPPRMGAMGHLGLQKKLEGADWKKEVKEYWENEMVNMPRQFIDKETEKEVEKIIQILERYFKHHDYFRSPKEKDLIEPETRFSVEIPNTGTKLIGYMDRVIEVPGGGIWLVDHKFTTQDLENKLDNLELNEQIDYYTWALTKMFPDKKIMGAIWNGIRMKLPTVPEPIKSGKRLSKRKMTTDYETYYQAIIGNGFDPSDYKKELARLENQPSPFFRTEWIDRDKREIRNIEKELMQIAIEMEKTSFDIRNRMAGRCSWDCNYQDICIAEKKGGDVESLIDEYYEDYYKDDEKEAEDLDDDESVF